MVEAGFEGEAGVVDEVGVERDSGAAGRAAEEVDDAAFASHLDGPLPGFECCYGLEDDVGAAALGGEGARCGDGVGDVGDAEDLFGSEVARSVELVLALDDGDDVETEERCCVNKEQTDGAGAENDGGLAGDGFGLFEPADDAGQGLGECGVFEGDGFGDGQGVFGDDARGNSDELSVGTIVEEEIVTEILLIVEAEEASAAGCGVQGENAVAQRKVGDAITYVDDGAGEFVAEETVEG